MAAGGVGIAVVGIVGSVGRFVLRGAVAGTAVEFGNAVCGGAFSKNGSETLNRGGCGAAFVVPVPVPSLFAEASSGELESPANLVVALVEFDSGATGTANSGDSSAARRR